MVEHADGWTLAARLGALIEQFTALETEMLGALAEPLSLHERLLALFRLPITPASGEPIVPYREISPGITLGFSSTAEVRLAIVPRGDYTAGPDEYLNSFNIDFSGISGFLSLETSLLWSQVCNAERFQLAIGGEPSRAVLLTVMLRLPTKPAGDIDLIFDQFEFQPASRSANRSGSITMPDLIDMDTARNPTLLIFFDSDAPLNLRLDYLNLYFA